MNLFFFGKNQAGISIDKYNVKIENSFKQIPHNLSPDYIGVLLFKAKRKSTNGKNVIPQVNITCKKCFK